jgi:hypothetical protein
MDFVSFRLDKSQSTLPGDTLLSSKHTKIDSKKANYEKKHLSSKITTKPNKNRDSEHLISGNITLEPVGEKTRSIASLQITLKFKKKTSSLIIKIL